MERPSPQGVPGHGRRVPCADTKHVDGMRYGVMERPRGDFAPPLNLPGCLERELQPELDIPGAARTEDGIAGYDVGCGAPAAEPRAARKLIARIAAIRCAVGIGDDGVIEQVKHL